MGEHDRAIAAGQRALATTSGAFDVQVVALTYLGIVYYAVGDYRQSLDVSQRVMALLTGELLYERFGLPVLPAVLSRGYVAECLAELGSFVEGAGIGEEAVRLAEGDVAMHREPPDIDQAAAHYRQALALAEEPGRRPLQAHCHLGLGTLYTRAGQRQQAPAVLSDAIDLYRGT